MFLPVNPITAPPMIALRAKKVTNKVVPWISLSPLTFSRLGCGADCATATDETASSDKAAATETKCLNFTRASSRLGYVDFRIRFCEVTGVHNNVIGTRNLTRIASEFGLRRFIMVSTDKAVRPANVMGATKRAAELIVQAAADHADCRTAFGIVRFGNVLDSSGSVVQLFRRQISEGQAVTVTHRDVTRFFMSIPEATQLVLQAAAMAERGEVFVLDMGEPVRIHDLAVNMIRLSGLTVRDEQNPDGDIPIHYVGLRPGEKLYEELFVGSISQPTTHPRIRKARERQLPGDLLEREIDCIVEAIRNRDAGAVRAKLMALVAEDHAVDASQRTASAPAYAGAEDRLKAG